MAGDLTPKQRRFVEEYLVDLNATQAAIRAGYSGRTARQAGAENLAKPVIREAVAAGQAALSERTEVSQNWVVTRLRDEATLTGEGASHSARVKAIELLGRHIGMWPNKVDVSGSVRHEVKVVSDADRLAALNRLYAAVGEGAGVAAAGGEPGPAGSTLG